MHALGQLEFPSHTDEPDHQDHHLCQAATALGLALEVAPAQLELPPFYLWPECVPLWGLWVGLQTQWRYAGMEAHPTGLCYAGVQAYLQAQGYGANRQRNLRHTFDDLRAMEGAALRAWAEERALKPHG